MTDDLVKRLEMAIVSVNSYATEGRKMVWVSTLEDAKAEILSLQAEAEGAHMIIASERGEVMALRKKVEALQAERRAALEGRNT